MSWVAQDSSRMPVAVDAQKKNEYDKAKAESLPAITKEAEGGVRPVEPVKFQPVRSPGIYEAEFGVKEKDIIFHFWPDGYHNADRDGRAIPAFKKDFLKNLTLSMHEIFHPNRITIEEDKDMGAFFVKAHGWGENDNYREISIKACEAFHHRMGGESGS